MKSKIIVSLVLLLASLSLSRAQTVIAGWTFDNLAIATNLDPAPVVNNSYGAVSAASLGMTTYAATAIGNNDPDVLVGASGDSDTIAQGGDGITNLSHEWRIRAQNAAGTANGWDSMAPVGFQGAQFSADTTAYTNIQVAFDWYLTKQGEANLQLEYTVDGVNWSNGIPINIPLAQTNTYIWTTNNTAGTDPNSVVGYFVHSASYKDGQEWFTNLTAVITNTAAANNPNFGIRLVNASTGTSCVSGTGAALNNSSGNWRFDNVQIIGSTFGAILTPPVLTNSTTATVDGPFTNTFVQNASWTNAITAVSVNNTVLPNNNGSYSISANGQIGQIVFTPALSTLLQKAGTVNITVAANGYAVDTVSQSIAAGAPAILAVTTQPTAPTGNGGTFVVQPQLTVFDQYSNVSTSGSATYTATPSAGWGFGAGSGVAQALTAGTVTFTNLSATNNAFVSGASITFTASGASGLNGVANLNTNSTTFNLPAPTTTLFTPGYLAVEQLDSGAANNSTFSILELNPSASNSAPVFILPVPATQTNGMRQSSSASTGDLADSDDGTLLCFSAAVCADSTVSDITTVNQRGAGTFNSQGNYVLQTTYSGDGADSDQARSAVTVDDVTFYIGDKGGVYTNNETTNDAYILYSQDNPANVRSLKSFGGTVFALQQEGSSQPNASVMAVVPPPATAAGSLTILDGFPIDGNDLDFYALRSGNNGSSYDTIYYIDGTNATSGSLWKFYFTGNYNGAGEPVWASCNANWPTVGANAPSWPTPNGGDGLCAVTNVNGGVDLYYTSGKGSTEGNSVVHLYDSGGWDQPINLTETNVLYVASAQVALKGIAFAPLPVIGNMSIASYNHSGFTFSFNSPAENVTSASFTVWSSTNIGLPFNQWKNLGNPTGPTGAANTTYSFTDTGATASQTYYRVTSP